MSNILMKYILLYIIVIPFAIFCIINLLSEIFKIRNNKNDRKIFLASIFLAVPLSIILSSSINMVFKNNTTIINAQRSSDLKWMINVITDFKKRETEIIYARTQDINTFEERKLITKKRRPARHEYKDYYYLNIGDGEYIIPVKDFETCIIINDLLYNNKYGEQINFINEIEVYKNTKFIKSINGINLDSDSEAIQNFINEKEYKIKINITDEGALTFETDGCTLKEYITQKDARICVLDEKGEKVVDSVQIYGFEDSLTMMINSNLNISKLGFYCHTDGIYYAHVYAREDKATFINNKGRVNETEKTSNGIKFKVEDRKVIEFTVMEN